MRKGGLLIIGILILLSAALTGRVRGSCSEKMESLGQTERPRFYAVRVLSEKDVINARNSLGVPDGHETEILPGGKLVIILDKKLYPLPPATGSLESAGLPDSGSIIGKGGEDIRLEGCLEREDAQIKSDCGWILLGISTTGFYYFPPPLPPDIPVASTYIDMIRISNPGTESLFVDAVIGYGDGHKENCAGTDGLFAESELNEIRWLQ